MMKLLQRELVKVEFDEIEKDNYEFGGEHLAIVMNYSDENCQTAIVVPLSSKKPTFMKKRGKCDIGRLSETNRVHSIAIVSQITAIDKKRIVESDKESVLIPVAQFDMILKELCYIIGIDKIKDALEVQ